jgi:hypothetical protein
VIELASRVLAIMGVGWMDYVVLLVYLLLNKYNKHAGKREIEYDPVRRINI